METWKCLFDRGRGCWLKLPLALEVWFLIGPQEGREQLMAMFMRLHFKLADWFLRLQQYWFLWLKKLLHFLLLKLLYHRRQLNSFFVIEFYFDQRLTFKSVFLWTKHFKQLCSIGWWLGPYQILSLRFFPGLLRCVDLRTAHLDAFVLLLGEIWHVITSVDWLIKSQRCFYFLQNWLFLFLFRRLLLRIGCEEFL